MFVKLLRLEFRATGRIFLPLMGAVMALSGMSMLAVRLAGPDALIVTGGPLATTPGPHNPVFSKIMGLLVLAAFLSMVALMVCTLIVTIQRFYKNLLGDEGYLMFTLPAAPAEHLAAKLTAGVGWTVASLVLVLALTAGIVGAIPVVLPNGQTALELMLGALHKGVPVPLWQWYGVGSLLFVVTLAFCYLELYFSMVVGAQRPERRPTASILVYVALRMLLGGLSALAAWLAGTIALRMNFHPLAQLTEASQFLTFAAGSLAAFAIGSAVWFLLTRRLLERRLNLA